MAGENEQELLEVKTAIGAIRETVEKYGKESGEFKEMLEKTEKAMEADQVAHQKAIAELQESIKKSLEQNERVDDLEVRLAKMNLGVKENYRELPEYKALDKFVKQGHAELSLEEVQTLREAKTMRMDDGTAGGYLTTTEMDTQLIKTITEISPVRQVARVKTVSKKTLEIAKRTVIPVATYEGEAADNDDSQSTYANEQLTVYRQTTTVPYTHDLLMDSNFNLESEINSDIGDAFAFGEGNKFVLGTGAKQPEGFLVHPDIVAGASTTAGSLAITGDDLLLLTGELKVGYNPLYGFNRQTLAYLRTLKGSDGQYLWQNTLVPGAPNEIGGNPYVVMQDMPSIAANALSVIYGDFARGYTIIDRTGMLIIRDDVTLAGKAIIKLTFHRWNTGQVTLSEAFIALKIKA